MELSYPRHIVENAESHRDRIEATFGVTSDHDLPIEIAATGLRHLLVGVASVEELRSLRLDRPSLHELASNAPFTLGSSTAASGIGGGKQADGQLIPTEEAAASSL